MDEELFGVLLSVLRTGMDSHPGYADLHYYTGVALERVGEPGEAGRHLRRALRINPKYVKALMALSELSARGGQATSAVEYLQRAVRAGAEWPDVHARLGDLLAECGRVEAAKGHYRRALRLNGRYRPAAKALRSLAA